MIHNKFRYLLTLVALFAMTTGAWAQTQITQDFENGLGDWTTNHCHSNSGICSSYTPHGGSYNFRFYYTENYPQYLISPEIDAAGGGTMSFYYARYHSNYPESFKVGYSTTTNDPTAFTWGNEVTCTNVYASEYLEYTYDIPAGAKYVAIACTSNDQFYLFIDDITIDVFPKTPDVEVTTNAAQAGDFFTEASFEMPTGDVTVDYELVRDMAISMPVTVGTGNDGYRIRIKKDEQSGKFVPAETDVAGMMALIKVHDAIENEDLTFFNMGGAVDCSVNIYAIDAEDKPVGDPIAFPNLVPGRYIAKAVAATGSAYEGETQQSNIFVLFQGFELEIAAGEYATFYKEEPLYVEDEDAKLYTISSVTDTEAVLSEQIIVAPALTPLLVYNSSDETKTFLLIPSVEEADDVTPAEEFKGTLVAKTFSEDDMAAANHFVLTAAQAFVWVKNAGTIAANKCWLELPISAASNARVIVFGDATGIDGISDISGMSGDWFDLNGRKLQKMPTKKGIYILNGRKVVVK